MAAPDSLRAPYPRTVTILGSTTPPAATTGTWFSGFASTDYLASRRYNSPAAQNDAVSWDVSLQAGLWTLDVLHYQDVDGGIYTIQLDGATIGTVDGYASTAGPLKSAIVGVPVKYSGTHRLTLKMATKNASSSSYVGRVSACVFVRPDKVTVPTFNPLSDITWAAAYWASDPAWSNPGSGQLVSTWRDGSGNGFDVTQTGSNRPTYVVNDPLLNNRPVLSFNAAAGNSLFNTSLAMTQPLSVVAIFSGFPAVFDGRILATITAPSIQIWHNNGWATNAGASITKTPFTSDGSILANVYNGSSSKLNYNRTSYTSQAVGSNGVTGGFRLGVNGNATTQWNTFKLAFFAFYNGDVTAAGGWANFKAWAAAYYGTQLL